MSRWICEVIPIKSLSRAFFVNLCKLFQVVVVVIVDFISFQFPKAWVRAYLEYVSYKLIKFITIFIYFYFNYIFYVLHNSKFKTFWKRQNKIHRNLGSSKYYSSFYGTWNALGYLYTFQITTHQMCLEYNVIWRLDQICHIGSRI